MARPVRIHIPGGLYLVQLRSRPEVNLFQSDEERALFLESMGQAALPEGVCIYAFALPDRSALILLRNGNRQLSRFVHRTQAGYFNRLRARNGEAEKRVRDRHRAILIEDTDEYFLRLVQRVHISPIIGHHWSNESEARRWGEVSTNQWTSFPIFTDSAAAPTGFDKDTVLQAFSQVDSKRPSDAFYMYIIQGMKNTQEDILDEVVAMSLLGSKAFIDKHYEQAKGRRRGRKSAMKEARQADRQAEARFRKLVRLVSREFNIPPDVLLKARARHEARKFLVELAMRHALGKGGVKGLGEKLGVSGSALAHLHRAFAKHLEENADARRTFDLLEGEFLEKVRK
ncbi:hypothetical protein GF324_00635 [bacterium]|nr:hypothetical protein [bacterium]